MVPLGSASGAGFSPALRRPSLHSSPLPQLQHQFFPRGSSNIELTTRPPLSSHGYSSHTWSRGHRVVQLPSRKQLTKCLSFDQQHQQQQDDSQSIFFPPSPLTVDLQTLRCDPTVASSSQDLAAIRPPTQDIFRMHKKKPSHVSTENVWVMRHTCSERGLLVCNNDSYETDEDDSSSEEEIEIKLPCKSVSISVVQLPTAALSSSSPIVCTNPRPTPTTLILQQQQQQQQNNGGLPVKMDNNDDDDDEDSSKRRFYVDQVSPCCRYRRQAAVSLLAVGALLIMTFSILYWNYHETMHRRLTKKQGVILDHWGKGAPSDLETALLAMDSENTGGSSHDQDNKNPTKNFPSGFFKADDDDDDDDDIKQNDADLTGSTQPSMPQRVD